MQASSLPRITRACVARILALIAIAIGTSVQPASAAVLFDQSALGGGSRASSTLDFLGGTPGFRTADDFTLTSAASVETIHWLGDTSSSGGDDFTFTFYADAGEPGAVLLATTGSLTKTLLTVGSATADAYSTTLATPFAAAAGTRYWLSIYNAATDASWAWRNTDALPGNAVQQRNDNLIWGNSNLSVAFKLEGAPTNVPVPASLVLVAFGLLLLGSKSALAQRPR